MDRQKLFKLLSCPIKWGAVSSESELVYWLNFGWYAISHRHQIDREVSFLFHYDDCAISSTSLDDLDDHEVSVALHNVQRWHETACDEYTSFYRRFVWLRAVDARTYNKHYSLQMQTSKEIAGTSAIRGASILLPYIKTDLQESLLWAVLDVFACDHMVGFNGVNAFFNPAAAELKFRQIFDQHSLTVAVDFFRPVGATNGKTTQFACIDLDFSTPQFHIYPISKSEYDVATFKCSVPGWKQGLLA